MRKSILKSLKPDIIVEMLDMAVAFENWNKVIERADMLYQCVQSIHEERQEYQSKGVPAPHIHIEQPLVYYYGFSHLMRGMAHQKMGQVDQARACIDQYAELGWMEDLDEVGMLVVQEFRHKAQVNRYALEIEGGQVELLEEFVNFLLEHPEEGLAGLKVITEAAVRHRWQIDRVLHMIEDQMQGVGREIDSSNNDDMYHYCYQRALYEQWMGRAQKAVEFILQAIRLADKLGLDRFFIRCIGLLESLREEATAEQIGLYRGMLEEMK
ncbi:DNA-binding protein [Paenibacillus xylanexedens]|uniref:DNA-binding protein n=1 Tax=Paenibacillus xylanexedens TaxID=528191 RepID=UPI001F2E23DE|nr:DNA-binding protein [Paenibacillus xylanexedens]MCF7758333.1 DNA-binding protein [Paenibacillus xylanexedens]